MAYDLQKLTPTHMLHAGRYSALGMDVASQVGSRRSAAARIARARHGCGATGCRTSTSTRTDTLRTNGCSRSPGTCRRGSGPISRRAAGTQPCGTLRDPRYPDHAEATEALREAIVREINANADVRAMDLRHQARYRKWAYGFGPYVFNQEIYKDTAIYYSDPETGEPNGSRRFGAGRGGGAGAGGEGGGGGTGRFSMNAWPQVTFFSGGTEAPDETAQGEWLNLVAKAGFSYLMASVKYLRDGRYTVHRIEEDSARDAVSLTTVRIRPVMPGRTSPPRSTTVDSGTVDGGAGHKEASMRSGRCRLALSCGISVSPSTAYAQNAQVIGAVKDSSGAVIPGATVTARNIETGLTRVGRHRPAGRYRLPSLPPGRYAVSTELSGFSTETRPDIMLIIDQTAIINFTLKPAALSETVTVTGESPIVDITRSDVSTSVSTQQIQDLPVASRRWIDLAMLTPGTSQDNIRGQFYRGNVNVGAGGREYSNGFVVDGVNNTWAEMGEPRQNFAMDAIQEFKVVDVELQGGVRPRHRRPASRSSPSRAPTSSTGRACCSSATRRSPPRSSSRRPSRTTGAISTAARSAGRS